ncbi:hypothetical protein HHA03_07870 [Halolactibacillus halophilus]|uniref:Uncharacterized protein n=1 Tax=Halolactibacillus halophilus TaxID=306540 RepID=A0ABQ0VJF8_9BACI|nr:hypothetical protein HHA03_07870 [Halolactibacillus halophilus]
MPAARSFFVPFDETLDISVVSSYKVGVIIGKKPDDVSVAQRDVFFFVHVVHLRLTLFFVDLRHQIKTLSNI